MPGHSSKTVVTQVRLPNAQDAAINAAAEATGMAKHDVMKLCLAAGLKWLEAKNYDVTQELDITTLTIVDQLKGLIDSMYKHTAASNIIPLDQQHAARVAEDPPKSPKKH